MPSWFAVLMNIYNICILKIMEITYDPLKNQENIKKHGIDFADVEPVFYDENAFEVREDKDHDEQRFVAIGVDALLRIVVVVYAYDEGDEAIIRVISARKAEPHEIQQYRG